MTTNRSRLIVAFAVTLAALALIASEVVRLRGQVATDHPSTTTAPTTQSGSSAPTTTSTLSAGEAATAKRIVAESDLVARISAGTGWSTGAVIPLVGVVTSDPFLGAAVEVHFDHPVAFPGGMPTLRTLPEGQAPLPLSEMVVASTDHGQQVEAITALLNLRDDRVFAVLPGP